VGIDLHNLNFLAHAQDLGVSFERTLAIGRQVLFVDPPELAQHRAWRGLPPLDGLAAEGPPYFEPLLRQWLGARVTDSVDASPYEQATLIHDMNLPWPAASPQHGHYDAVLDFGCLEHVFDFPTAWRNCVALCRVGGHVLHALPMNNLAGHGFYQFSPELFCNLYQPTRGFELRGLYAVMKAEPRCWWRVANPLEVRRRVTLCQGHEVYLLVLARKLREVGDLPAPQQSDYALAEWQAAPGAGAGAGAGSTPPSRLAAPLAALGLLEAARRWRHRARAWAGAALDLPAPDYQRIAVAELLRRGPGQRP
jgi:SAM-dependent methyltransferase